MQKIESALSVFLHEKYEKSDVVAALVIYNTKFGNTEKVANALVQRFAAQGIEAESVNIVRVAIDTLSEYDASLIGEPTHRQKTSELMAMFLDRLDRAHVSGKPGFALDTKAENRFAGSAGRRIEKKLKKIGMKVVMPRASAIVVGREGRLKRNGRDVYADRVTDCARNNAFDVRVNGCLHTGQT